MSIIQDTAWLHQTPIAISIGKRGTHATVKEQRNTTLAVWLKGQTKTNREGVMTAAEYVAADKELRGADKSAAGGGWYSFAHYDENHRAGDNWKGSNIVVIDADAKHGHEEGPQYSFTAAQLAARLDGLQFVALPTHSYTDECPRWRIVIPMSEVVADRAEFAAVAKKVAEKLNSNVDARSYTPEQYWFSMSAPKGEWANRLDLIVVGG
jgi:hypothetical protein